MRFTSSAPSRAATSIRLDDDAGRTFGVLSSFPPTACGIATFSAALSAGLTAGGHTVQVVRTGLAPGLEDSLVLAALADGTPGRVAAAADVLNAGAVAIIQHEYGIYDGADGEAVLDILQRVEVPVIVVAHTVLRAPTPNQRRVLIAVCEAADAVVVMTESGRVGLVEWYGVDADKVLVIPHGATTPGSASGSAIRGVRAPRLLTWGLLGPGKGIEWAIDAVATLTDLDFEYLIAGATHPRVRAHSGEAYRTMLIQRARRAGAPVSFDDAYRDLPSLMELIASADLVILPYDSADQVTSGVLVDAVAAGRPVVSTAFPHAVELLASGAGLVVPQRDPAALARAIRSVLTDGDLLEGMAAEARRLAPSLSWEAVAAQYAGLADRLLAARASVRT